MSSIDEGILPIELELEIVSFALCERATLASLRLVCQRWNDFASSSVENIQVNSVGVVRTASVFRSCSKLSIGSAARFESELCASFPSVHTLDLSQKLVDNPVMRQIAKMETVTSLLLNPAKVDATTFNSSIASLTNLQSLVISVEGLKFPPKPLFSHPSLKRFEVRSFTSYCSFSMTLMGSAFSAIKDLSKFHAAVLSIDGQTGPTEPVVVSACTEAHELSELDCRFVLAMNPQTSSISLLLWTGTLCCPRVKLQYQSTKNFIARLLPVDHTYQQDFSSHSQLRETFPLLSRNAAHIAGEA
jgi:hypothetical protein